MGAGEAVGEAAPGGEEALGALPRRPRGTGLPALLLLLAVPAWSSGPDRDAGSGLRAQAPERESGAGSAADRLGEAIDGLSWRSIGPAEMGGRTTDVAGLPGDPSRLYFATATGGLWRSTDGGTTWTPLLEDATTTSIGDIAVSPSDPEVLWVGTGENNPRNSTSVGDGIWRSTDGGETWTHAGLPETERVGRIRVHPDDPDVAWVAAMGRLWGPNAERGVFRTTDGGRRWSRVLYVDEDTGAADLALHPTNPRILYATTYDHRRRPWHFRSGGPGSGLWRSTDGGLTWTELTDPVRENGLPDGTLGRIGVAVSPADPDRVYAIIESHDPGVVWRSDDAGDTWRAVSEDERVANRPFYYSDLRADPTDANTLFALAGGLYRSVDGGVTWERIASNIHGDHHALWIDPADPDRILNGNDGGFHVSRDGGDHWEHVNTVPLGQFYHIAVDDRYPYRVCGGLQDNDVWCGPSRTLSVTGPLQNHWYELVGPGDGMWVAIHPEDPDVAYTDTQGGDVYRVDLGTGQARSIHPYPVPLGGSAAREHPLRFGWDAPLILSPHDPETVYLGGNVVFRTRDGGQTWERISPDLSDADSSKLASSGGPITPDNTVAEYHATITALAESPVEPGLLWAGTDDGNLHLTRDGGETWTGIAERLADLPAESWFSHVEPSPHVAGTATVAVDRHRSDDMAPYLYRTTDFGRNWTDVTGNLPTPGWVHVVREDPRVPDLLYAGTETGVWASWSGGGRWTSLRAGLPPVPVRDIRVHPRENDLVLGTHGRSVWILDDIGPVQTLPGAVDGPTHLFPPRPAIRYEPATRRFRFDLGDAVFVGENPPYGALVTYWLAEDTPPGESAEESDGAGAEGEAHAAEPAPVRIHLIGASGDTVRTLEGPGSAGLHRVAWDLRHAPLEEHDVGGDGETTGSGPDPFYYPFPDPRILPGRYVVALEVPEGPAPTPEAGLQVPLEVRLDPRLEGSDEAIRAQHALLMRLREAGAHGIRLVRTVDAVTTQLEDWTARLEDAAAGATARALADSARDLIGELERARDSVVLPEGEEGGARLLGRIRSLMRAVDGAAARPTAVQDEWTDRHLAKLENVDARLETLLDERLARFNAAVRETGLTAIGSGGR